MLVTIYQPQYFPRLHYFNRIFDSDIYVPLDSAQYVKVMFHNETNGKKKHKSYQSDTPIKLPQGVQFLTIPIRNKGFLPLNMTKIDHSMNWQKKHLRTIEMAYKKSPYFNRIYPEISEIITNKYNSLAQLNVTTILWAISKLLNYKIYGYSELAKINNKLNIENRVRLKKIIPDSNLGIENLKNSGKPNEWIVAICKSVNASKLYHGKTSKASYMDIKYLKKEGIRSVIQDWQLKEYSQRFLHRKKFIPNLSILDILFNTKPKKALNILTSN